MPTSEPQLVLPVTNLQVTGTELIRRSDDGAVVFRIPLDTVRELRISKRLNPFSVIMMGAGSAIGFIGFRVAESNSATVILSIIALATIVIGLLSLIENRLSFRSNDQRFFVVTQESNDVVSGFVGSIKNLLNSSDPGQK